MVAPGFNELYKAKWVCGVVTIPDGRVMTYRRLYSSGPTRWSAALRSQSFGPINPKAVLSRLSKERFGVIPDTENIKHILTYTDFEGDLDARPTPAWDYHYADYKTELLIYRIKYPKMVKMYIKHEDDDVMPMPFGNIVKDVRSGAWEEFNITVFNVLDKMCKEEFDI